MRKKIIALLLCLTLLPCVPALADALGQPADGCTIALYDGVALTETTFWTGKDLCTEHFLTVAPASGVTPTVVSADTLWDRQSLAAAAAALAGEDRLVLGGVNGGFYTVATGEPVGLVVSDGVLRRDAAMLPAVGFRADGSAVLGDPALELWLRNGENVWSLATLNGTAGWGLRAYTADCAKQLALGDGKQCALCTIEEPLPLCGSVTLNVTQTFACADPVTVPAGQLLLAWDKPAEDDPAAWAPAIREGDVMTLEISCDAAWQDVVSAVGILYPLVTDGAVVPGLAKGEAPRTAIGLRPDGTVVLYTVDGRQSGYSVGADLTTVAKRMLELGCTTAGALDGGGSTQMSARLPGDDGLCTVNRPSETPLRKVSNYIFLTAELHVPGPAAKLALYPLHVNAVAGAEVPLTVKAVDAWGNPAAVPKDLTFAVSDGLGTVQDGVFHAAGAGEGTVTVSAPGLTPGEIPVRVTTSPEEIRLYGEVYGRLTEKLTLDPGQEVDLTVKSYVNHILLTGDDTCYTWELDPAVGTVDDTGHLTPGPVSGSGMLRVTAGETVKEIPITVWSGVPFRDILTDDPLFPAVKYVYDNGILIGTGDDTFDPDVVMDRAMLTTVLWRVCGREAAQQPADFADVAPDSWYGPAVAWATECGIVYGYDATTFAPTDDLTKEQILTILYRRSGAPAVEGADWCLHTAADAGSASDWALPALEWALRSGIISADAAGSIHPDQPMSRAAVAQVLMRWLELPKET